MFSWFGNLDSCENIWEFDDWNRNLIEDIWNIKISYVLFFKEQKSSKIYHFPFVTERLPKCFAIHYLILRLLMRRLLKSNCLLHLFSNTKMLMVLKHKLLSHTHSENFWFYRFGLGVKNVHFKQVSGWCICSWLRPHTLKTIGHLTIFS